MKMILGLILVFWNSLATAYSCPAQLTADQEALRLWLHPWSGTHEIQNCRVEITVCSKANSDEYSQVVAEVYIVDAKGREAYIPLSLEISEKIEARADLHSRTMYYFIRDKYFEATNGRTETTRLELVVGNDGIRSLDLGQYATNKRLTGPSKSRWYNCGQ